MLSDAAYYNSLTCLDPSVSTQLVGWRIKGDAQSWGQIEILLRHSWWRSETEALKEGGEEEEELHPCQTLTDTRPATWHREQVTPQSHLHSVQWNRRRDTVCLLMEQTCRERHEGISLDELPILIKELGRIKAEWTLPFSLIPQNRRQERIHYGALWTIQEVMKILIKVF